MTDQPPAGLYERVRAREGRLLPDELAARLPQTPPGHPLAGEWRIRQRSADRLRRYLEKLSRPLVILEPGCGNGWLSNRLSQIPEAQVIGLDRSSFEIAQAARLFGHARLSFLMADMACLPLAPGCADVIVLASVIQYFPDLPALIAALRPLLRPGGEVHLLDSPLYAPAELPAARERTRAYYASLGFPEMTGHYFHHSTQALAPFSPRWLYRPGGFLPRLHRAFGRPDSPFPWVRLR